MNRDLKLSKIEKKECEKIIGYNKVCLVWGDDFYIKRSLLYIAFLLSESGYKVVFHTLTSFQLEILSELLNCNIKNGTKIKNILFTMSTNRKISFDENYDVLICEYTENYNHEPFGRFKKEYYGGYAWKGTVFYNIVNSNDIEYISIIKYNEFDDEFYIHENKERLLNSREERVSDMWKSAYLCDWTYSLNKKR